ncbi:MAG: hypothetical protein AB1715_02455, partial [Acidobacteriota bacterium]
MEKRLILAIVLSFLVLLLYQVIFLKNKPQSEPAVQPQAAAQAEAPAATTPSKTAEPESQTEAPVAPRKPYEEARAQAEEEIVVDTPLYQAVW